jgi:hypothetical protein
MNADDDGVAAVQTLLGCPNDGGLVQDCVYQLISIGFFGFRLKGIHICRGDELPSLIARKSKHPQTCSMAPARPACAIPSAMFGCCFRGRKISIRPRWNVVERNSWGSKLGHPGGLNCFNGTCACTHDIFDSWSGMRGGAQRAFLLRI